MIIKNNWATLAIAGTTAILGVTALIVVSGGKFDSNWTKDGGSITIEGKPLQDKAQ